MSLLDVGVVCAIPQSRPRFVLVGIRRQTSIGQQFALEWGWPPAIPAQTLSQCLGRNVGQWTLAVPKATAVVSRSVHHMQSRVQSGALKLTAPVIVDCGASRKRMQAVLDGTPCVTRARASQRAFFVVSPATFQPIGIPSMHRLTVEDFAKLQGWPVETSSRFIWIFGDKLAAEALGNAINYKLKELLLERLLHFLKQ